MGRLISWLCNYNAYHVPLTMVNVVISCSSDHFAACSSSQLWSQALCSLHCSLTVLQGQDIWLLATFPVLCICINSLTPIALRKGSWSSANDKRIRGVVWRFFVFDFFLLCFSKCANDCDVIRNELKLRTVSDIFPLCARAIFFNCFFFQHTLLSDITPITLFSVDVNSLCLES